LDQIARQELPIIEQGLARVRKAAEETVAAGDQAKLKDTTSQRAGLAQTEQHQDAVLAALEDMLDRLSKWETYRGIARDARELLNQQQQITQQTQETGRETIGQARENLAPEAQTALNKLAARQDVARDQLIRLQRKMEQMSGRLAESDPVGADAMRDAT